MHSVQASPRATNRMLKKSASFVLTSLRGSTYRSVRLASSLAAALLDSLLSILLSTCNSLLLFLLIKQGVLWRPTWSVAV